MFRNSSLCTTGAIDLLLRLGCVAVFGESTANTIMFSFLIVALLFSFHATLTALVWWISGKLCNLIERGHKYSRKHVRS
jgi:hypothetical protein